MTVNCRKGFTLIEILVTTALLGIVMMAIYSLYLTTQKTASTQDEVVELQQNLRIAMDQMVRDIRMAGFVVSFENSPVDAAVNLPSAASPFRMNTACPTGRAARLKEDVTVPSSTTPLEADFVLAAEEMVDMFYADPVDGDTVRILRPPSQLEPNALLFTVIAKDKTTKTIRLKGFVSAEPIEYRSGDGVVLSSATYPGTISFYLQNNELYKQINSMTPQRVTARRMVGTTLVNGITNLQMQYLLDGGSVVNSVTGSSLYNIKAVRVTLTGQATVQGDVKTRTLTNVIGLRNR